MKRDRFTRIAGICGILAPIVAFSCIGISIYYSPWFTWTGSYLSDLAGYEGDRPIWTANGNISIIYNSGLIIAGILGIVVVLGLIRNGILKKGLGRIASVLLILDMIALSLVGILPEPIGAPHVVVSAIFFFLAPISLMVGGAHVVKTGSRRLGWATIAVGVAPLCSLPLLYAPQPIGSNALIEMFPSTAIAIFGVVYGSLLLIRSPLVYLDGK